MQMLGFFFITELFRQSYPSTESLPTTVSSRSKVSTQPSDLEPTYPPLPPYPPPPPSTSPPPYSFVSRDQSFDSGNGGTHPRDGASSPSLRDRPPPPYSFAPRTLPHDMNKPQPAPRHQFFKAESLTLEHGASDRDYHLMPDRADRGEYPLLVYYTMVHIIYYLACHCKSFTLAWYCLLHQYLHHPNWASLKCR